jgi:hypothetical protein
MALPIQIKLKDPSQFPHQNNTPSSLRNDKAFYLTNSLKKQGLLISCSSPYNTSILATHKGPNKWRLVQDLWFINEAVIPSTQLFPIPITLLAQISSKAQYTLY